MHPAYDLAFDGFAEPAVHGKREARQAWAVEQMSCRPRLGQSGTQGPCDFFGRAGLAVYLSLAAAAGRSDRNRFRRAGGALAADLDAFDGAGVDLCYEIHPGEDLHDGATFEMFLERVGNHPRCNMLYDPSHFVLQQLDYLASSTSTTTASRCFT